MAAPVFWFTGLSGAGKTTIANATQLHLADAGIDTIVLDGDDVRARWGKTLGFSREDILENNRLTAELAAEVRQDHDIVLVPIISPLADARKIARDRLGNEFHEIHIRASVEACAERDTKGLYARAAAGTFDGLIGVSPDSPYEPPAAPDLVLDTETDTPDASARRLAAYIHSVLSLPTPSQ